MRCFAICTVLYLVPLQYRIVAGCCLKSNLQIRAPGNGWTLFSLAAHPCPLDCSCRAESRANKYMRSHPPAYSHLTSTCTSILRLITCSHRNTNIQPAVLQHQFPYDDLAIHACRTSPSHGINCSQRLGMCIAAIPQHQRPTIILMGTD